MVNTSKETNASKSSVYIFQDDTTSSSRLQAISSSKLLQKCVNIPMSISATDCIAMLPNMYEHH